MDFLDRANTIATVPSVCMHCDDPTCAKVCPADAIKKTEDGVVQSSLKPRCIACSNCVLACPFGIPKMMTELEQMMKCDMCYDRTSEGKRPMCATVCPSQALTYVPREQIERTRLECPCHEGYFSIKNGDVLQGPPPRPLPRVVLERRGTDIVAVKLETRKET